MNKIQKIEFLVNQRAEHFRMTNGGLLRREDCIDEKRNPNNCDIDFDPPVAIVAIICYA